MEKTKFLGLILYDKLRWQDQMDVINNKVAKAIGILHAGRSKLNFDAKRTLYNTLVLPHLQYGAEIWGNATKTRLKRIKIKQKQAVRMIYKKNKRDHTSILFRRGNLLQLEDIIRLKNAIIVKRYKLGDLPVNINNILTSMENGDQHNTRQKSSSKVKHIREKATTIKSTGPKVWNSLEKKERLTNSLKSFKKMVGPN